MSEFTNKIALIPSVSLTIVLTIAWLKLYQPKTVLGWVLSFLFLGAHWALMQLLFAVGMPIKFVFRDQTGVKGENDRTGESALIFAMMGTFFAEFIFTIVAYAFYKRYPMFENFKREYVLLSLWWAIFLFFVSSFVFYKLLLV